AVGLVVDDAWYVLLGRSLARGEGFALTSSAATPILPSVPPGFPVLLATVFRLAPAFPDNLSLLKAVSIAAMIGTGCCLDWYAPGVRGLPTAIAWLTAVAVALTPGFVFLAASTVMADCVFTLLQLAAVIAIDRASDSEGDGQGRRAIAAAGLVVC